MLNLTTQEIQPKAKHQHCPICNRYVKINETHKNYICFKCTNLATDKTGKSIAFYDITNEGNGLQGKYLESGNLYRSPFCFVKGVKCKAIETVAYGILIIKQEPRKRNIKGTSNKPEPEH